MNAVVFTLPDSSLSCLDRCDRCGAQAYVAVDNPSLLFCAHHYAENAEALKRSGAVVAVDCRDELRPESVAAKEGQ